MLLNTSETIDSKAVWLQCGMEQDLSFLILFRHRHKDKAEALVAGMYAIRSQRPCAPGVLASHSIMFAIEEEVGES